MSNGEMTSYILYYETLSKLMTSLNKAFSLRDVASAMMKTCVNSPRNGKPPKGGYGEKGYKDGKK